ncbi:unnamed protein product [Chironomus riparius]|uniref:Uncharacterized protein n=1 Tax=Chironomus riparius TaxID=315576 RepID=A0A9N9RY31_9DIPT|nr:unnamed protein product [Chironomus riparius]
MMNTEANIYTDYELAGNMMEEHEKRDQQISVEGVLQRQGGFSGLNDFDYQDLSNLTEGRVKELQQIRTLNKIPIPNEIMENFKNIKCHCRMGLFPEIGRAWLTIDSDIYIWTYEHARDVAYFDGLNHLIVSVGLIKPKPNVFINDVKYLLVLTTPIEIVVLGVTFGDTTKSVTTPSFLSSSFDEMQLMNKPIFVINTDNVAITCIEGTSDGRIFLGGRDGCLYEISYQAESNWLGKRCKKVNHSQGLLSYVLPGFLKGFTDDAIMKIVIDNQRFLLYTLTEKGAIEVWDLQDNSARRVMRLSQNDVTNAAVNHIKTVDSSIFKPVVDICVLERDENPNLYMIAVTQSGVRFYFGGYTGMYNTMMDPQQMQQQSQRLQSLNLQHVRLAPGYTPNTNYGKPKNVHSMYYNSGSVLLISTPQQEQDLLWSLSSEPFLHSELSPLITADSGHRMLTESSTIMHLDGSVWAVADIKDRSQLSLKYPLKEAQRPKKVILLTSQGAHIVELLKPVDILQQLFMSCHGAHNDAVKSFFELQSEPESCATSLLLSCMESMKGTEMSMWATQAFFRYGGEPYFFNHQQENIPRMFMSTPYAASRPNQPMQPSMMQQTQIPGSTSFHQQTQQIDLFNLRYSAKHGGLYLHIARILRPIWNRKCIDNKLSSTITIQDCNQILSDLFAIRSFLESNTVGGIAKNSMNILSANAYTSFMTTTQGNILNGFGSNNQQIQHPQKKEEAFAEEKKSLDALFNFIKYVCEVFSLWKILCEHQLHVLLGQFPVEQRQLIETCTFRDLITIRNDLCAFLIVTIINSYLNDNASVKLISEKLREVCPTLYRNEDAVSHKATEILKLSKNCVNEDEKYEHYLKALELCIQAAPKLPLATICQQFSAAGFYEGVIKLCTTFANKLDPNETALHFYRNNYPFDINQMQIKDQEGYFAYSNRMKCYEEVKNMFQFVFRNLSTPGNNEQQQSMSQQLQHILNVALQSTDQLLHVAVYEWMLFNNLLVEMLSITNSSLGDFLSRSVTQTPINLQLVDLLWKYFERNGQHASAAKTLDKLATLHSEKIPLSKRIEYLARAVMSMRSDTVGYSSHHGEMLRDLEDKLEVAQIQKQIYDTLTTGDIARNIDPIQVREAVRSLDIRLFNMTQLYSDFAENFDLWECQLTILNSSHHNEARLINSVWSHILDKELDDPGSNSEKAQKLLSKVQSLASEFGVSPCFPLDYLIGELELRCFQLRLLNSPVPEALFKINADVDLMLDIYTKIVTANDRIWLSGHDELYLIRSVKKALSLIIQKHLSLSKNRRRTIAKMEDLISASLNALYTKQGTQETKEITDELRSLRQSINVFN